MFWRLSKIIYPGAVCVTPAQYAGNDLVIEDTQMFQLAASCRRARYSRGAHSMVVNSRASL